MSNPTPVSIRLQRLVLTISAVSRDLYYHYFFSVLMLCYAHCPLIAIIIGYLEMLDEEREALKQDITLRSPNHLLGLASTGSTDDEGHHKRRASPTDLGSGIRLQKRPSIKLKSKKKSQYGLHGHGKKISPTKDTFGHADPRTTSPSTGGDPYFAGPASFSSASNLSSSPSISAQPTSPMDMDTN